ncbi:MAG: hypothetical protein Q9225_004361 [Loekoesia sp. 1 TL-2023]
MLGKRKSSRPVAPVRKRRKSEPPIEEITFDFNAREEYLTGFHKRKLQRIKHAKEEALKKEREEKVAARKALRESRRVDREKHVEAIKAAVRSADGLDEDYGSSNDQDDQWNGIEEPANIDHEDDYPDEDRHTVVTVEAVDVSREGLQRRQDTPEPDDSEHIASQAPAERPPNEESMKGKRKSLRPNQMSNSRPKTKFRYENKAERKITRFKERIGGKAKAKARRG